MAFNNNGGGNFTVPTAREGGNSIGLQNNGEGKFNWPSTVTTGEFYCPAQYIKRVLSLSLAHECCVTVAIDQTISFCPSGQLGLLKNAIYECSS